jgi:hypothetical protein
MISPFGMRAGYPAPPIDRIGGDSGYGAHRFLVQGRRPRIRPMRRIALYDPAMSWPEIMRESAEDFDEWFREQHSRPPPWCRLLDEDEVEDVAWQISRRLGSPARRLDSALQLVRDRLPLSEHDAAYMGWTEPLSEAAPRFGFHRTEFMLYVPERSAVDAPPFPNVVEIGLADMLEFETTLWWDNNFLIDSGHTWVAWGPHDHACRFLRLRGP